MFKYFIRLGYERDFLNILTLLDYVASTEALRKPVRRYRNKLPQLSVNATGSPDAGVRKVVGLKAVS